jgi:hypothetical protein
MADRKISELPVATGASLADTDLFVIVDTSADENKSLTKAELVAGFGAVMENDAQLSAIAQSKGITAVDGLVYNTAFDTDGGAWIYGAKARASSWYNEALNTSTRGATRGFPAVAVILAEATKITIYDGTDPALPMWKVFNAAGSSSSMIWMSSGATISSISMKNGVLIWGQINSTTTFSGLGVFNLISETGERFELSGVRYWNGALNSGSWGSLSASRFLVSPLVNDVAMHVYSDAPIDPATGLQIPTIVVGTAGGTSVINNDGTVADSANTSVVYELSFTDTGLWIGRDISLIYAPHGTMNADGFGINAGNTNGSSPIQLYTRIRSSDMVGYTGNSIAMAGTIDPFLGLQLVAPDTGVLANSMTAYLTSTFNTGWMVGDIKGAFLSSVSTTSLLNGGVDLDRSVNANNLNVVGTVPRTPVATGAELVGYGPFSAANYLEQPYNSGLNFGTGDFSLTGWINQSSISASQIIMAKSNAAVDSVFSVFTSATTGHFGFFHPSSGAVSCGRAFSANSWNSFCITRKSGLVSFYINGFFVSSSTPTSFDLTRASDDTIRIGKDFSVNAATTSILSILRISATAPTAAQIAKSYNDEKYLFRENALAVLSADAVTALSHDPVTNLLYVGGASGMATISGITPVSRDATAVTTFISVVDGMEVKQ